MDFIKIAMEDEGENTQVPETGDDVQLRPDETEQAAEVVENLDSTEPAKQLKVANYKEELAILQQQKANEQAPPEDGDDPDAAAPEEGEPPPEEGNSDDDSDDGDDAPAEPESDEDEGNDDSEEEPAEPVETDAEMGEEAEGKPDEQVAQEQFIVQGYKKVREALEAVDVMSKHHGLLKKRNQLGGVNPHTASVITTAFEHYAEVCGYKMVEPTPALESYQSYTGSAYSTFQLQVGIENFLTTIWEAIKKFFKSVWTWIMDLLSPKKATVQAPNDKSTRDKAVKELEVKNEKLIKQLEKMKKTIDSRALEADKARDETNAANAEKERLRREAREKTAKLNQKLAAQLFKTFDKGSFNEISQNARQLHEVVNAANAYAKSLATALGKVGINSESGRAVDLSEMGISKSSIGGITFNEVKRGDKSAVFEANTDEILGGIGARFIFAGTDLAAVAKRQPLTKVIQELGQQGFKMVSVKDKSGFPPRLPELDKADVASLKTIVLEIQGSFSAISAIQDTAVKLADMVKKKTEGTQPASWANLDKTNIAILQAQLTFVGLIETNLVAGYKSMSDQVNNFRNSYERLADLYIIE